jgi:hypothetical protein
MENVESYFDSYEQTRDYIGSVLSYNENFPDAVANGCLFWEPRKVVYSDEEPKYYMDLQWKTLIVNPKYQADVKRLYVKTTNQVGQDV